MTRRSAEQFEHDMRKALAAAATEAAPEAAFGHLTQLAHDALGDPDAVRRDGALLPGERNYRVAGVFAITPDRRYNMLLADRGFPPEQRRLAVPIEWNHPGEVVRTKRPILLENTDDHGEFRQFLKTSRMGSSLYHPILTPQGMVAQIVTASQVRWTYDETDLARLSLLAHVAALIWQATDATRWLAADYPADDLWRAEDHV